MFYRSSQPNQARTKAAERSVHAQMQEYHTNDNGPSAIRRFDVGALGLLIA